MAINPVLCERLFDDVARKSRRWPLMVEFPPMPTILGCSNSSHLDLVGGRPVGKPPHVDCLYFGREGELALRGPHAIFMTPPSAFDLDDITFWTRQREGIRRLCGQFFSPNSVLPSFVWMTNIWLTTASLLERSGLHPSGKERRKVTRKGKRPQIRLNKVADSNAGIDFALAYDDRAWKRKSRNTFRLSYTGGEWSDELQLLHRTRIRMFSEGFRHFTALHEFIIMGNDDDLTRMRSNGSFPMRSALVLRYDHQGMAAIRQNVITLGRICPFGFKNWPPTKSEVCEAKVDLVTVTIDPHDGRTFAINRSVSDFELIQHQHPVLAALLAEAGSE